MTIEYIFVTDTKSNHTEMRYNSLGRKRYMSDPDMGVWSYGYDANGNLITQTDAKGQTITFVYDELNRLKTKHYPTGTDVVMSYDETASGYFNKGRLTRMTDASGQTVYNYDNMGRIATTTKTITGSSYTLGFGYLNGRLDRITYPDNETVSYGYHPDGNLKNVGSYVITYSNHDSFGRPRNVVYGNQASTILTYDPVSRRLTDLSVLSPTQGLVIDNGYGYDNKGNITSINHRHQISPIPTNFSSETYTPARAHAVGSTGSGRVFQYDANGNIENDGIRYIIYNYDNMPTSIGSVSYTYDGNGTRVKKTTPNYTIVYVDKLYECASNGSCTKYIFAGNQRIALKDATQTLYYHPDHQGSTSLVTNAAGYKAEWVYYYPFGETRGAGGPVSVNHLYTGQEKDHETGLYNYNARIYDPDLGRFLTPDSIVPDPGNPQSLNRYSYTQNNPTNLTDPSGHCPVCIAAIVGAIIGAVSSGAQNDWNADAMLMGAGIGAVSGAVFNVAGTYAAGEIFSGLAGSISTDAALNAAYIGGAIVGGAAAGATAAAMSGGDPGAGAGFGALGGAAFGSINSAYGGKWDMSRVGVSTLAGGGLSAASGGDFKTGALFAFGASTAAYAYNAMLRYNPNPGSGKELPDGTYDEHANGGRPPQEYRVVGNNERLVGDFWKDFGKQGGAVGSLANLGGLDATGHLHDFWMNNITKNLVTNWGTMVPAAAISYGALAGGQFAPVSMQLINRRANR